MSEMLNNEKVNQILKEQAEKAKSILDNREEMLRLLVNAEEKIRSSEALASVEGLSAMINAVRSYVYGNGSGISEEGAAVMTGTLQYLTESEDYFADNTPVIGLLDDMAVIWAALERVKPELQAFGK